LILEDMDQILVPVLSTGFQNRVHELVNIAYSKLEKFSELYQQTETILLEEVGLKDFEPSKERVNVKTFKESFLSSGRLDAEYYQRKYEDYLSLIYSYSNGYDSLEAICTLKDENFTPEGKNEYKYIELADIGKSGEITGNTTAQGSELPSRARRMVNTHDVIISSIEGSLESCALVSNEFDNALCSTGFYIIISEKINSETLLVLFKSNPMQNILKKNCSGTILTAINKSEFLNVPIPLIHKDRQETIKLKITESFQLRKQSETLLEVAKRAVEIAIDQGEDVAINYIKNNSVQ
jgi:type I restriction enzyme, S subunit